LFVEEVGGIDVVRVCMNAPSMPLLLFPDDSLILMKNGYVKCNLSIASFGHLLCKVSTTCELFQIKYLL
jgi:hypothetical protein